MSDVQVEQLKFTTSYLALCNFHSHHENGPCSYDNPPNEVLEAVPNSLQREWSRHQNGGGWVHEDSYVSASVWLDQGVIVCGYSVIVGNYRFTGKQLLSGINVENHGELEIVEELAEDREYRVKSAMEDSFANDIAALEFAQRVNMNKTPFIHRKDLVENGY